MEDLQYIQVGVAGCSVLACFLTFWVFQVEKSFRMKIFNLFILFQQIGNLFMALGFIMDFFKDSENKNKNFCALQGFMIEAGVFSSVLWYSLLSFYYFLRFYLKYLHTGRFIMGLMVLGIVLPIAFGFFDVTVLSFKNDLWCRDWIQFNFRNLIEPCFIAATFGLQIIFGVFLWVVYRKGSKSTFKMRFVYFDLVLVILCFGVFEVVAVLKYFGESYKVLNSVGIICLAASGLGRFMLSDCILYIHLYKEKKLYGDLTDNLIKPKPTT